MEKLLHEIVDVLEKINKSPLIEKKIKDQEFMQQKEFIEELSLIVKNLSIALNELKKNNLKDKHWINNQLNDIFRIFGGLTENYDQLYTFIRKLNYQYCDKFLKN